MTDSTPRHNEPEPMFWPDTDDGSFPEEFVTGVRRAMDSMSPDDFDAMVLREVARRDIHEAASNVILARTPRPPLVDDILHRGALDDLPPVAPLIDDFLFQRTSAVMYGRRGAGKTFIGLAMALSIATGKAFLDTYKVEKGKVLWVAGEGAIGIASRVRAWEEFNATYAEDFHTLKRSVAMADPAVVEELAMIVTAHEYDFVVIDTLARNSVGLEENSATDMKLFFERVDQVRNARDGATVLVIHHAGKSEAVVDARGSTVIEDAPDTVLKVAGDEQLIKFETKKQRDVLKAPALNLYLHGVLDSMVVREHQPNAGTFRELAKGQEAVFQVFVETFGGTGCGRKEWCKAAMDELGTSESTIYRQIKKLQDAGRVDWHEGRQKFMVAR